MRVYVLRKRDVSISQAVLASAASNDLGEFQYVGRITGIPYPSGIRQIVAIHLVGAGVIGAQPCADVATDPRYPGDTAPVARASATQPDRSRPDCLPHHRPGHS